MAARFILSLDCEGKWGVADHLGKAEQAWLTDKRLRRAYARIVDSLDDYEIPATFAFVGAFAESPSKYADLRPDLLKLARHSPYLSKALAKQTQRSDDGWHGHWAVEMVGAARATHEFALHGVTHVPWTAHDADFFESELQLVEKLSPPVCFARTFVFPRNKIAHLHLLRNAGFLGYRRAPRERSRVRSLLAEFNLAVRPEADPLPGSEGPQPIPAGFFVNWQHGPRSFVPQAVTMHRLEHLLNRAEACGDVVHLWMHPENIASAPTTGDLLEEMMRLVADRIHQGRCRPLTQLEYVEELR